MSNWERSKAGRRTSTARWRKLSAKVIARDARVCHFCGRPTASTAHHLIAPEVDPSREFDESNLVAACRPCHDSDSGRRGAAVVNARRAAERRPAEPHPGLLDDPPGTGEPAGPAGAAQTAQDAPQPPTPSKRSRGGAQSHSLIIRRPRSDRPS